MTFRSLTYRWPWVPSLLALLAGSPLAEASTLSIGSRMGEPLDAVLRVGVTELDAAYLDRQCFVPVTGAQGTPLPGRFVLRPGHDASSLRLATDRPLVELAYALRLASDRCPELPRATLGLTLLPGAADASVGEATLAVAAAVPPGSPEPQAPPPAARAPAAALQAPSPATASPAAAAHAGKPLAARVARPAPRGRERGLTLARSLANPPDEANPERSQFRRDVFAALQADPEEIASTLRQVDRLNALAAEAIAALAAAPAPAAAAVAPATNAAATPPARSLSALPDPMLGGVTVLLLAGSMAWLARRKRDEQPIEEDEAAPVVTVPVPVPRKPPAHASRGGHGDHHDPREDLNFSVRLP